MVDRHLFSEQSDRLSGGFSASSSILRWLHSKTPTRQRASRSAALSCNVDLPAHARRFARIVLKPESLDPRPLIGGRLYRRSMSTIPLTPIVGAMALPRLHPFDHLPAPFGRDWALLPPVRSLRAELKALYAAVLRTFCMSEETIRSLCKWMPLEERRAAAATVFDAPLSNLAPIPTEPTETQPFAPVKALPFEPASQGASVHWSAIAGGACALGGAAMLAWIAVGHLGPRHTLSDSGFGGAVTVNRDAPLTDGRASDAVAAQHAAVDNEANGRASGAASAPMRTDAPATFATATTTGSSKADASGSATATASVTKSPNATGPVPLRDLEKISPTAITARVTTAATASSLHALAGKPVSRRRDKLREKTAGLHKKSLRHNTQIGAIKQLRYQPALNDDMPHLAASSTTQHTLAKPSAAGLYSPLAPSRLGVGEYASVAMSAGTHLHDIAPPSRAASASHSSGTNGTEWMNHISQRRVTEVPDQFSK